MSAAICGPQPDQSQRVTDTLNLLTGRDSPRQARAFVRSTGARFLLKDCNTRFDVGKLIGPLIKAEKRFGCAAVYRVR